MKIGLAKALLYYKYGVFWETFFRELGCEVILSGDTRGSIVKTGMRDSVDECCLPFKIFMGHIHYLSDKCDYILVPCFKKSAGAEKTCVRFSALYDVIRSTYKDVRLLDYTVYESPRKNKAEFMRMGKLLGKNNAEISRAYKSAAQTQLAYTEQKYREQTGLLSGSALKILVSGQPYVTHDPYIGGQVTRLLREQGAVPLFSDNCGYTRCIKHAADIAPELYWTSNMESAGAVSLYKSHVDGVIVMTAFPCGADALVNEMILRKVKDVPVICLLSDGLDGDAGLITRLESFIDILNERRRANAG